MGAYANRSLGWFVRSPQRLDVTAEIVHRETHIPDSAASNVRQIRQIRSHRIGLGAQDLLAWIIVTGD